MQILVDYRPALRQPTGVGDFVHNLTQALLDRIDVGRDRVTLFSSSWKDRLLADRLPGAARLDARIPVRLLNLAWHRLEWPPIEMLGARPDLVWSLHPLLMPSRRAASVVTVPDLYFLDHPEATAAEIRRDYAALAARHTARADAVVVISEYVRKATVERLQVAPEKIAVCHPGRPAWKPRDEPPVPGPILHVGTIEPRKNVGAVITAYGLLSSTMSDVPPLVFAGRTSPGFTPAARPGCEPPGNVRFLGYVSPEEKLRLYREASMLVLASFDEGFGIPALEAMTLGVPVVAANRGSLPEVIGDAGLLVDVDSPQVFAGAMTRVLADAGLRRELARRGIERARRFDWGASADLLLHAFRTALGRRQARG